MASTLISNGTIITLNQNRRVLKNSAVLIQDGRITYVGNASDARRIVRAESEIDASGMLVLPGLIDTHVHLAQALIRGCADDTSLIDWLQKFVWPLQGNFEAEDGKVSAELCMLEMIKSGTTTFLESLLHSRYGFDGVAQSVDDSGMRGILSKTVMGLPGYGTKGSIMHPGMIEAGRDLSTRSRRSFRTLEWERKRAHQSLVRCALTWRLYPRTLQTNRQRSTKTRHRRHDTPQRSPRGRSLRTERIRQDACRVHG